LLEERQTMAHPKRRSGRIAKEIPISLLGTDTTGKVFSEQTKTVVLSRHGAGILSRYAFAPDEVLTLRLTDSSKEAEVRLVGQIGGEPGRHVYGVAFVDPALEFWPIEFPPPEPDEPSVRRMSLECSLCQSRENVEQSAIEQDVYSVNGSVLRYCQRCCTSTPWKKAIGEAASPVGSIPSAPPDSPSDANLAQPLVPQFPLLRPPGQVRDTAHCANSTPHLQPAASVSSASAYSGSFSQELLTAAAVIEPPRHVAVPPALPAPASEDSSLRPMDANGRRVNRRKHMRVRVNFSACVRHPAHSDEIVECENISKGGLCFHSRTQYAVGSQIEVAAPYSPGEAALFVPAQIRRVEPIPGSDIHRYGVAYLGASSPQANFATHLQP